MSLSLGIAFIAGLATFFSPCMLPVVPGYLAVLSGGDRGKVLRRVILFTIGMALTFTILGVFLSWLGQVVVQWRDHLVQLIGGLLAIFGFHLIYPKFLPGLAKEMKLPFQVRGDSDTNSVLLGAAFGVAWTPCTGVILGLILAQALQSQMVAATQMLLSFALGMSAPLIALAILYQRFGQTVRLPHLLARYYNPVLGGLVILLGVRLATGLINDWRTAILSTWPNLEPGLLQLPR